MSKLANLPSKFELVLNKIVICASNYSPLERPRVMDMIRTTNEHPLETCIYNFEGCN
jgi:hypothetical protein